MRALARLTVAAMLLGYVETASAQSVAEIVEKHLAAAGGRQALVKLKSRVVTAAVSVTTPIGDLMGTLVLSSEAPNKERSLITLDLSALGAGQVVFEQRFDGKAGYAMDPLQGNRAITGNPLDNLKNQSFPDGLLDYEQRGITITLAGKEKVGDRDAFVLVLQPKAGSTVRTYIDAETFQLARTRMMVDSPETGPMEQTIDFSDYRDVDGYKFPFLVKTSNPAQTVNVTITKIENNVMLDQSIFSAPAN